jgi:hypothetical protein
LSLEAKDSAINIARDLARRGWSVVPIEHREKAPKLRDWQKLRLGEADLPQYFFNGQPMNIGVLLGEPSGELVDIDLDHTRARELADDYLPATGCTFGRTSAPRSHRLYRVNQPINTAKHKAANGSMIVELRSTGCQTIAPGSTHPSGERIEWHDNGEPAEVDPGELADAVKRLSDAVKGEADEPDTSPVEALGEDEAQNLNRYAGQGSGEGYAEAALRREVAAVESTERGGRNDRLNTAAFNLGQLIASGALDRDQVERELFAAAEHCGLVADDGERQALRTIASGIEAGLQHPRDGAKRTTDPPPAEQSAAVMSEGERSAQRQPAVEIIKAWLRERYAPAYREGGAMFSPTLGGFLRPGDVLPDSVVIERLTSAKDAPRYDDDEGHAKRGRLPALFSTWARVAFGDVLAELPSEESATAPGEGRFPRLIARLLTSMVTLGNSAAHEVPQAERRTIVAWGAAFTSAKHRWGTWQRLRSLDCWAKRDEDGRNLTIAIRPALAHQIGGASELSDYTQNRLSRLASAHGIGEAGKVNCQGQQTRAVILRPDFIGSLAPPADPPSDDQSHARGRARARTRECHSVRPSTQGTEDQ